MSDPKSGDPLSLPPSDTSLPPRVDSTNPDEVNNAEYLLSPKYKPQPVQRLDRAVFEISPSPGTYQSISSSHRGSERSPSKTITGSGESQSDQELPYNHPSSVSENSNNGKKSEISDAREESNYSE